MLLNCDRNRMNGPRFVPSGNRLDPYSCSRLATSPASRPFVALVLSCLMTSSAVMACHVDTSLADLTFEAASMAISPLLFPGSFCDSAASPLTRRSNSLRRSSSTD